VNHRLASTASNQISVGALADNGNALWNHQMLNDNLGFVADDLTVLWSHTSQSKMLATAVHFMDVNSVMVMYLN